MERCWRRIGPVERHGGALLEADWSGAWSCAGGGLEEGNLNTCVETASNILVVVYTDCILEWSVVCARAARQRSGWPRFYRSCNWLATCTCCSGNEMSGTSVDEVLVTRWEVLKE